MTAMRFVLVLLLGLSLAGAASAQDAARGAALLAEARKALGGEQRLAAVERLQANGTIRMGGGNFNVEGDLELFIELPDKFKRKESLTLGGGPGFERTQILNGTEVIQETSGGGPGGRFGGRGGFAGRFGGFPGGQPGDAQGPQTQIDPERLREAQRRNLQTERFRTLLAVLLRTEGTVAWIGTAQSPDGTADVLEVTPPPGLPPVRLLLDAETHMPLMLTWTAAGPGGGRGRGGRGPDDGAAGAFPGANEPQDGAPRAGGPGRGGAGGQVTQEMHLSEYKTVNGLKLPHLITRGAGGQVNEEIVVRNYRINPNFRADTFKR